MTTESKLWANKFHKIWFCLLTCFVEADPPFPLEDVVVAVVAVVVVVVVQPRSSLLLPSNVSGTGKSSGM